MANTDYEDDIFENLPFDEDEFYEAEIISLENDEGDIEEFEVAATVEYNGNEYYALFPIDDETEEYSEEPFVILKLIVDPLSDGSESYISIDDEDEFNTVSGMLIEILEDDDYTVIS